MNIKRPDWNHIRPHAYGVLSFGEAAFLDRFMSQLKNEFGVVHMLEVGVAGGATAAGIIERCETVDVPIFYEGIDGAGNGPVFELPNVTFHAGDSTVIHPQVRSGFNFLFIDGSHALHYVTQDFLNYSPKVVPGGYVLFHDTREPWQGLHYQGTGPDIPENRIAVRWALKNLGLLDGSRAGWSFVEEVKDVEIQGMMLFKKLHEPNL